MFCSSPMDSILSDWAQSPISPTTTHLLAFVPFLVHLSGHIQDWERTQRPGTCRAPMYLQGVTQGEWVPAECLSRSEKKAAFSSYSSPALYNGRVMWRKELNKKAVTHY